MAGKASSTRAGTAARANARTRGRTVAAKAVEMGASDGDIFAGTLADPNSQRIPNAQQYDYLYRKHPWVRACVRIIANAVVQEGFTVAKIEGEDFSPVTAEDDPRVSEIFEFFTSAFNGKTRRSVIKSTAIDLEVHGKGYWREREQGDLLWYERFDPLVIEPRLNKERTAIEKFDVVRQASNVQGVVLEKQVTESIPFDEMLVFMLEGGDVVLGGASPLEALDLTIAMDLNVRQHRNKYFGNSATAGKVVVLKEGGEDDVAAVNKMITGTKAGVRNAYRTWVLAGDIDVHNLDQSGKQEVDFIKGSEMARDEICAVYSVPPSKLMSVEGSMGQAGKSEDDQTFEQECVLPLEELLYETMTAGILVKKFGITDLALVPKRRAKVRTDLFDAAFSLVKFGGTGNEARDLVGLPPVTYDPARDEPERKDIAASMDVPLFVTVKGQSLQDDSADASADAEPSNGGIEGANDASGKRQRAKNEVAGKASARFRGRRQGY
jgi:Phage portal protein